MFGAREVPHSDNLSMHVFSSLVFSFELLADTVLFYLSMYSVCPVSAGFFFLIVEKIRRTT